MWHNVAVRALLGVLLAIAIGGSAACGPTSGQSASKPNASATAPRATPSPMVNAGQVTLAVDKLRYATTDPIIVTITNSLATPISTADHHTECTLVTLERLVDGAWQPVDLCRLMTPTAVVPLDPGLTTEVLGASPPWTAGTYRVVLSYFTEPGQALGSGEVAYGVVYSADFIVV